MRTWRHLLTAALLTAGFCSCVRNIQPVDLSDAGIKARIETALHSQPDLDLRYLTIDVDTGVVTLSGLVNTLREREVISRVARRTRGVDQVIVNVMIPE